MNSELDGEALLRIVRAVDGFEAAWRRGEVPSLEALLRGESDGSARAELLRYALPVELEHRGKRGEAPTREDYGRCYPDFREVIRSAFVERSNLPTSTGSNGDPPPPASPSHDQPPHPKWIGRYEVLGRLGRGAQGTTYLARDPSAGRLVVLKHFHAAGDAAPKEAKALCRVRSRYTSQCHDVLPFGGELFLVMEYIPGRNLAEVMEQALPAPAAAARLAEQVAEGLEAVHACGLVHRDVKPSNVVVGDDGVARLVDFGLAAHLGSADLDTFSGTPGYMAPEQARRQGERIDARTDLYGLGGLLYAMLTGRPPHPGGTLEEVLEHARRGDITAPHTLKRAIPRRLERIVLKALSADPAQRYASAPEMRRALSRYRRRHAHRAAVGSAVLAVVLAGIGMSYFIGDRLVPKSTPVALTGKLVLLVSSPRNAGEPGLNVTDPGALPVLPGDRMQLVAQLSRPAYAYLIWIDAEGVVKSLHPWSDQEFHSRSVDESPKETINSPAELKEGWPMQGEQRGMETALLLVRTTPLPAETDLAGLIGRLPHSPLRDPQEVAVLGFDFGQPVRTFDHRLSRGLGAEAKRIDGPWLQMMERLRPHFETARAVRFAYGSE